jgi:hypothetical protein
MLALTTPTLCPALSFAYSAPLCDNHLQNLASSCFAKLADKLVPNEMTKHSGLYNLQLASLAQSALSKILTRTQKKRQI